MVWMHSLLQGGVIMGGFCRYLKTYMSMINISTQGDAVDFGDLAGSRINHIRLL